MGRYRKSATLIGKGRFRHMRALAVVASAALIVTAAVHASTEGTASADSVVVLFVINSQTNLCLDSNYQDPNASNPQQGAVYALPCNGTTYQDWEFIRTGSDIAKPYEIVNFQTGLCLDSNYQDPKASNPQQGAVYTLPCNGDAYQQWMGAPGNPNAAVNLQTNLCLDSNYQDPKASNPQQGAVYTLPCNGGTYQNWSLHGST